MDDFTVEVHHGGSFAHDPLRLPTVGMEDGGLRVVSIDSDKDAMAMVDAVEGHNVIELFVEHCVDVPDAVEEHRTITAGFEVDEDVWFDNVFEECNEGNEVVDTRLPDISEEFSNSEESSDDDGHSNGTNERCVRKLVTYSDMESDEDLRDSLYFGQGGIEQERIKTGLSDNEEAYMSEELLSMDDDDVRPQYPMYKPPKKAKYIKFEIGMKFNSLEEFKNVVTDYAIHGGHGIQFEKNDKVRVKAVCKKGCKWVAYAVKMAGEMTCQLRTFVNEHTCSRSYLNSRATSKWLGKKLTNRINEQPDMPCSTIQEKLIKDVNASSERTLTFISDEQKGLVLTFEEVFSGMEHRLSVRHMYNNFKKKFCGIHLKDLFWRIASTTYEKQWERAMKELKEVDRLAFEWVESKPKEKWCKHKFKVHSKCGTLVNNMCELFNGVILKARKKPIIGLVEDIRLYLMRRFEACREGIKKVEGDLCPNIRKKLSREKLNNGH
uniref:Transposase MuDR plant domain-containing protein n=1 Tax=Fagus sylvatica TaxID=28930 RepID=A0A2N9HVJ2_FAGSY